MIDVPNLIGSSPHTRGALHIGPPALAGVRIIPAYAGSTGGEFGGGVHGGDHPRIRGEHFHADAEGGHGLGSSPHTRGARRPVDAQPGPAGIIPAYAGSTCRRETPDSPGPDHPRIRGEHLRRPQSRHRVWGSSPHTRGARDRAENDDIGTGIIPAYAGSTPPSSWRARFGRDHPRIRGEHLLHRAQAVRQAGIIPAYAGSTTGIYQSSAIMSDHPRIRGEHRPV